MLDSLHTRFRLNRRLILNLLTAAGALPLGLILAYLLIVALAGVLPVEEFGLFSTVIALVNLLALAAALGFSTSMMRFVAAYNAEGSPALLRGLLRTSAGLVCLAATTIAALLFIANAIIPGAQPLLTWTALLLLPLSLSLWRESSLRGLHQMAMAIGPRQVILPGVMLLAVLALDLDGIDRVLAVYLALLASLELLGLMHLRRAFSYLSTASPRLLTGEWLRTSLPMGLTTLIRQSMNRWDVVIVGASLGFVEAGQYAAAARTALLANLVLRVVNLALGPVFAELYRSRRRHRLRRMLLLSALGSLAVGLPLYLVAMLLPDRVLSLFGPEYGAASAALQILATGQLVNLATGPAGLALTMSRFEKVNLRLVTVASLLNLAGLLILPLYFGIIGAALASSSALILLSLGQLLSCTLLLRADEEREPNP